MTAVESPVMGDAAVIQRNREEWLRALGYRIVVDIMAPKGYGNHGALFKGEAHDEPVPLTEDVNISCGWPITGGRARRKRVIGECWATAASEGKQAEIFISPALSEPMQVAETLTHELMHAAMPLNAKHGRRFAKGCAVIGLEGKPTATFAGDELKQALGAILLGFPPYPHKRVVAAPKLKSEKSRMHKVFCVNERCSSQESDSGGFKFRLTKTWVEQLIAGEDGEGELRLVMPCPFCNSSLVVELPEEEEGQ
jgi:hypothetical protein